MVFAENRSAKLPTKYSQIREQICLVTHFQLEFPILGCSGQSGLQRKKNLTAKTVTSVRHPQKKRDGGLKAVFLLKKKTAFTPASLFIFGRRTDVMALVQNSNLVYLLIDDLHTNFFNIF